MGDGQYNGDSMFFVFNLIKGNNIITANDHNIAEL